MRQCISLPGLTGGCVQRRAWVVVIALVHALMRAGPAAADVVVTDFGAIGDGNTLNTLAMQAAIDTCAQGGGGVVQVPAGRFLTGTIFLKNRVTLRLHPETVLLGSTDLADYPRVAEFKYGLCLIAALEVSHVGIEGAGTIDGQGIELIAKQKSPTVEGAQRPFLIRWIKCQDVTVRDVQMQRPAMWTMHLFQCQRVRVEGIRIFNAKAANNDGIDIDSSRSVHISNCDIDTHDDAIVLKATSPEPCRDVTVERCRLKSGCGTFKLGTESVGDFEDIRISDCHMVRAGLGGIKLLSVDGATIRNVTISNLTMGEARVPIFIRLGARLKTWHPGDEKRSVGKFENVKIENIRAKLLTPEPAIVISGVPGHPVQGVTIRNAQFEVPGEGAVEAAPPEVPEKEAAYPEVYMFGKRMPAYGLYARHVQGLRIDGIKLSLAGPDLRPTVVYDDAADAVFENCTFTNADISGPKIVTREQGK